MVDPTNDTESKKESLCCTIINIKGNVSATCNSTLFLYQKKSKTYYDIILINQTDFIAFSPCLRSYVIFKRLVGEQLYRSVSLNSFREQFIGENIDFVLYTLPAA